MQYHFEDLSTEIDGRRGLLIAGTAYLERDRHGMFWIDGIEIRGEDGKGAIRLSRSGSQWMIELFRAVEAAIYDSEHARDVWAAHVEEDRANAA